MIKEINPNWIILFVLLLLMGGYILSIILG